MTSCFLPGGADVCQTAGVLRRSDQWALPAWLRAAHSGAPVRGGVSSKPAAHARMTARPDLPEPDFSKDVHFPSTCEVSQWAEGDGTER